MNETGPGGVRSLLKVSPATVQRARMAWQVGQILDAVVKESRPGGVLLGIGGHGVSARSALPLQQGQHLQLEVAEMRPQVMLRILQPASGDHLLAHASRSLLPRQAPQAQLVQSLVNVLAGDPAALPADVSRAARALLSVMQTPASISHPGQLRAALGNSGLLFESKLQAMIDNPGSGATLTGDTKGLLANLLSHLFSALAARPRSWQGGEHALPSAQRFSAAPATQSRRAPITDPVQLLTELARQTDGALARTQLTQVNLAAADGQLPWLFELPIRDGNRVDQLQLVLDQEQTGSAEGQDKCWSVRISLDFHETGPLHCTVSLQGQAVSVTWWAERHETALLVDKHLPGLARQVGQLGLSVSGLRCVHGRPPEPEPDSGLSDGGRLFDEHV